MRTVYRNRVARRLISFRLISCVYMVAALIAVASIGVSSANAQHETDDTSSLDYDEHIEQLRAYLQNDLPNGNFSIRIEHPFVVIGDESAEMLVRRCRSIKWAVERLKKQYFEHDPDHIINIWLFKDKQSYESNVEQMFGEKPGTPYGYYSSRHRVLVMNISTGGGTLVHEIVHPFIERNFPECPSWFNEGLASLYEQSGQLDSKIVGYTNWRLRSLQRSIDGKAVQKFKTLCETTTRQFYDEDRGTNYAQARYLCYYLQQSGLLNRYYHDFVAKVESDPTGYETLVKTLGNPDMNEFHTTWQDYVMKLRFQ